MIVKDEEKLYYSKLQKLCFLYLQIQETIENIETKEY